MSAPFDLRALLAEGKHALSRGHVPEAVALIEATPRRAPHLIELLWVDDPGDVQRAGDVLERASLHLSSPLACHRAGVKDTLLGLLALIIGRLRLTALGALPAGHP